VKEGGGHGHHAGIAPGYLVLSDVDGGTKVTLLMDAAPLTE
jgi:hypothetical protein